MKHLVDLDEEALAAARTFLGTSTIKDTVNAALRIVTESERRGPEIAAALDVLGGAELNDRSESWR